MVRGPAQVTVTESIDVARPPEAVWDFTQDYGRRTQASMRRAKAILERDA